VRMRLASRGRTYRIIPSLVAGVGLVLGLSAALVAQEKTETPAAEESAKTATPAAEESAKPEEAAQRPRITIALGSMRQTVDGNPQRFWQYVTPPSGTHLALIGVDQPLGKSGLVFNAQIRDLLEADAGGVGYLYQVDQGVRVDSRYRRSVFYRDFYAGDTQLTRKDWRTDARWRVTPEDHLMGGYTVVELRGAEETWRRENYRGTYTRKLGSMDAYTSFNFEQFDFAGGSPYLSGDASTWTLGFGPSRDARTLIAGRVSGTNTHLDGNAISPEETFVSLSGFTQLTNDLTLNGDLKYWELEDSIAQTAYAKRERLAAIEGEWIGLPKTVVRAGFESADVDYVNGRQSQVLQPSVNTGRINVRFRPRKDVKLQADFSRRRVDARPLAYNVGGYPVDTLIYSQADMTRVRGSWTPTFAPLGLTAGYQEDERNNPDQGASNRVITRDLSAWWNVTDDVSATLSLMNQGYHLMNGGLATPLASDARSWSLGANWRVSDRTNLEASFSQADSFGAIELQQKIWSAALEHKWREHTVRLGLTLDDLNDYNGTLLGYDADLWYAEFSTQLP
jgi:hypothetical protein